MSAAASRTQVRGRNPWRRSLSDRPPAVAPEGVFARGGSSITTAPGGISGSPGLGWSCSVPGGGPQRLIHPPHQGFRHSSPSFTWYPPEFRLSAPPLPPSPEFRRNFTSTRGPPARFVQGAPPFQKPPQFRHVAASNRPFHRHPHPQPADYRNWSFAQSQIDPDCERFIVLSYNILADYLAKGHRSKLYFHIPRHILDWEWRKRRLLLEFGLWAPDIMCLQEVDRFQDLEQELDSLGYTGIWKMRTGEAVDGCAIFWRTNRFQLRHEEHIEFCKMGLRNNVSQICVLESRLQELDVNASKCLPASPNISNGASYVIVCNVHILYNPKRGDIKVGQVRVLLDRAYAISREWNDAPVVICGDFNCTPRSPLYNYISDRKLSLHGLSRNEVSGQHSGVPRSYDGSGWNRTCYNAKRVVSTSHPMVSDVSSPSLEILSDNKSIKDILGNVVAEESDGICTRGGYSPTCASSHWSANPSSVLNQDSTNSVATGETKHSISSIYTDKCGGLDEHDDVNVLAGYEHVNPISSTLEERQVPVENEVQLEIRSIGLKPVEDGVTADNTMFSTAEKAPDAENRFQGCTTEFSSPKVSYGSIPTTAYMPHKTCGSTHVNEVARAESADINSEVLSTEHEKTCSGSLSQDVHADELLILESNGSLSSSNTRVLDVSRNLGIEVTGSNKVHDAENSLGDIQNIMQACEPQKYTSVHVVDSVFEYGIDRSNGFHTFNGVAIEDIQASKDNSDPNFLEELVGLGLESRFTQDFPSTTTSEQVSAYPNLDPWAPRKFYNDPYLWTPVEIEAASGNAECTSVEHNLKLRSAYTDVEDYAGTKDMCREPQVTSYNRQFMGTVDYIWYSEGLQTVKVLDTIPKHVLQRTPGFPTQKWGSDHLALVCELAFTSQGGSMGRCAKCLSAICCL